MFSIVWNKRRAYFNKFRIFFQALHLHLLSFGIFPRVYRYFQVWWVFCNINLHILFMPYVYSRPYVYSFWQIFQALRLFPALRLFRTLEYTGLFYNDYGCSAVSSSSGPSQCRIKGGKRLIRNRAIFKGENRERWSSPIISLSKDPICTV